MIYVSNEFKQAFLSAEQKKLVLTFDDGTIIDNEDIAMESMELEQTLCDSEELRFGKVASACFKTKIKASTKRYKNLWFNAKISVGEHGIALGRFKVYTDNMTSDRLYREIVSYDALFLAINTDVTEWYNKLTFPITQKAFRDSLFEYLGIDQESVELPNDSITFNRTADVENLTGLTVLQKLCELNATWGTINNNGKFKYVRMRTHELDSLYPSDDLYPSDNLYPNDIYDERLSKASYFQGSLKYEEFDTQPISKVTIREDADDLGYSYGTDGNTYVIQGNFLMYGASDEVLGQVAKNFFDYAQYISYTPSELKCKGAPWREVGDLLFVVADKRTLAVPILNRKLSGITALKDNYIAKGTETYGEVKNSTTEQIKQLQSRTNKLTRTLDETKSEIAAVETDLNKTTTELRSEIKQSAEDISLEVQEILENYSTTEEMRSEIKVTSDEINLKVEKKVDEDEIISTINQTAEEIKINAQKISLEGLITNNNGFEVDDNGRVKMKGADVSGHIHADSVNFHNDTNNIESTVVVQPAYIDISVVDNNNYNPALYTSSVVVGSNGLLYLIGRNIEVYEHDMTTWNGNVKFLNTVFNSGGGVAFTSDRNEKNSIEELDKFSTEQFIYSLKPCKFKYDRGTSDRFHHGLIAQEVKECMGKDDWGLYVEQKDEDGTVHLALRYDELIADLISTVQRQNERIKALEERLGV